MTFPSSPPCSSSSSPLAGRRDGILHAYALGPPVGNSHPARNVAATDDPAPGRSGAGAGAGVHPAGVAGPDAGSGLHRAGTAGSDRGAASDMAGRGASGRMLRLPRG